MPRALVIEDDEVTARDIVAELSAHGLTAEWVANGRDGLTRALADGYDIITLDRMLPGMDGIDIVSALRERRIDTPVLMISALSDVDERVRGLRAGGDDYLTKPFSPDELAARAEVLLRRRRPAANETRLRVADLELDLVRHNALRGGQPLTLLPTEFRLLEFLMRNAGQVVTRQMIFEHVWGFHFDPGTNVIDVHIGRLRRKIDGTGQAPLIRTVRGSGYLLAPAD
ncbi:MULTISPECIES: response regulator transcription factor [Rhodanobacteraceae]|jgi:two-component system OmpR family response regulator|uniref:response regulator transcription factor n=1 Tax=Rhodanobacteraceae TaxID=1775411 RepID=UPI000890FC25|nr:MULTISPECIES: response regulator transcription factor [Rhodanobacteraceae]MDR6642095.1 two-component system OmpR family response regulator [Luteibacter sp. 1214]SDG10596.1 DNA-binding response regulator, OmpR family, contains REC and winged-helix (wHTH) domain [Dyella sp. 333MFSha]SKB84626.1 two component transcriptional regulator, winged helix family [Luteibacter sp. 22Crub2.1]